MALWLGDDSSMDAHHAGITKDVTVTESQCRTSANGRSITLKDETLEFKKGTKTTVVKQKDFDDNGVDLSDKPRNEWDSYGCVNSETFEGHIQDGTLKVRTKDSKFMSKDGLQLPCPLEQLGCDDTSFDPYVYTWDVSDNCVLGIHRKEDVNMINRGKKQLLFCQWTEEHQSVCIGGKTGFTNFLHQTSRGTPNQRRFVTRGYRL